jgi:hypothetical protein
VVNVNAERTMLEPSARVELYERVRESVLQVPDVAAAAVSFLTPASSGGFTPAVEVGADTGPVRVEANQDVFGNLVSPGWFGALGTPIVAGRDVADGDRRGTPGAAIVNEAFAHRFFGGAGALGRTLTIYPNTPRALRFEIVGIAADAVWSSPRAPVFPSWFIPMAQFGTGFPFEAARVSVRATSGPPAQLSVPVAAAITAVNPRLALTSRPLVDQLRGTLTRDRLMAQLAGFFAVLALLLAALGLYGVSGYIVARRRPEIGIRLALGATPCGIMRTLLARMTTRVGAGIVAGAALSLWASAFVDSLVYNVPRRDTVTMIAAALVLAITGVLAAWLPARRAARFNPIELLRAE